jgi:hypothetical protein
MFQSAFSPASAEDAFPKQKTGGNMLLLTSFCSKRENRNRQMSYYFPAESRLKDVLSGFRSVDQSFTSRLKAERRGEKGT